MASPEKDPIKELQELTAKAGESLDDSAAFDAAIKEISDKLLLEELKRLDKLLGLSKQHDSQLAFLKETGLVYKLSNGLLGIRGVDGVEYEVPSLQSIVQRFCEDGQKYELLRRKVEQGFTKLILVPFGLPLDSLVGAYARELKNRKASGALFGEGESSGVRLGVRQKVLSLNMTEPVCKSGVYDREELDYFPTSFDPVNHGGLTKQEAISQKGAWQVYLIEETPIPRKGQGARKNGRHQLEAGLSAAQYLEMLQSDPQYKGEMGLTPEAWLMRALTRLKEKGEVIDEDAVVNGSANFNLGAIFRESSTISFACWNRSLSHWAFLGARNARVCGINTGASTAVMI